MRLEKNPVYRKVIVPWYDSDTACCIVIILMMAVFLFGITGIMLAQEEAVYLDHVFVPFFLTLLSGGVIFSTFIRLIKRYINRFSK